VWLKRRTLNIVIGGAPGASAPLIAWVAVTGRLELRRCLVRGHLPVDTAHFWALSLFRRDTTARRPPDAGHHGESFTRHQILIYSVVLALVSLAVGPLAGLGR
jgi:protoheme IX farnesyltransferase